MTTPTCIHCGETTGLTETRDGERCWDLYACGNRTAARTAAKLRFAEAAAGLLREASDVFGSYTHICTDSVTLNGLGEPVEPGAWVEQMHNVDDRIRAALALLDGTVGAEVGE